MYAELVLSTIIIILIIILLFLIYNRRRFYEEFKSNPTSFDLYLGKDSTEFDKQMFLYKDTLGDINDLLLVYGCGINLGSVPTSLNNLVKSSAKDLYTVSFSILTNNYQDINAKIYKILEDFHERIGRLTIEGQVYVVISQAPLYRDEQNNPIAIQYNADNYLYDSTNLMKNTNVDSNPTIQFNGYVIFNAYDNNGMLIGDMETRKTAVINIKKNFRQKEKLCFVSCPNHNKLPCGCASQTEPYASQCLESERSNRMSPGEKYTYAILYRINPRFADLIGRQILAVDYSDYEWSPGTLNKIPTIANPSIPSPMPIDLSTCPPLGSKKKNITLYQRCGYGGWKSKLIAPGRYTMDTLKRCFNVKEDASAYKQAGGMKVKMYTDSGFTNPVSNNYITGNVNCFTKYKNLDDNLKGIEISDQKGSPSAKKKTPSPSPPPPPPPSKSVTFYQHCGYKGWKSKIVPPGRYTMDTLQKSYNVKTDASAYQQVGGAKVKLYTDSKFTKPVSKNHLAGNLDCFTKYKNLNDKLKAVEIV